MRTIEYTKIVDAVEKMCIEACYILEEDVIAAIEKAVEKESDSGAREILGQLLENAEIAERDLIPLCQDTGLAVFFVELGSEVVLGGGGGKSLSDAINEGVERGYERGYLRKSVVADPLKDRVNTKTNTPAIIHISQMRGDGLKISFMAKGGGCENKSAFKMFNPTAEKGEIIDWVVEVVRESGANACPPFVVGVGIGGDFEQCCIVSKKALLRKLDEPNKDVFYAELENEILAKVNSLGLGPQGLGGDTTALGVLIEAVPCHIASLPVAVNIECHSHRHKSVTL
ncbi:MAG: fumarate hydratase [Phycisphaerae bacterium]|nr:fumarate hydratase [Phycisphaerae bacterium]